MPSMAKGTRLASFAAWPASVGESVPVRRWSHMTPGHAPERFPVPCLGQRLEPARGSSTRRESWLHPQRAAHQTSPCPARSSDRLGLDPKSTSSGPSRGLWHRYSVYWIPGSHHRRPGVQARWRVRQFESGMGTLFYRLDGLSRRLIPDSNVDLNSQLMNVRSQLIDASEVLTPSVHG